MLRKSNISKAISFAAIAALLCGIFTFAASAADPVVIDFSKYDWVDDVLGNSSGGQGEFAMVADGDRWVLFAECVDGYDPADDPEGTGTMGDLYESITGFGDLGVNADTHQWIALGIKNPSNAPGFEIHFESPSKGYHVESSVTFDINPNSDYTKYVFNVTDQCKKYYPKRPADVEDPDVYPDHWHGDITALRLDFMYYEESGGHAKTGDTIYVEYIAFFDSEQAANDFAFTPARTAAAVQAAKDAAAAEKDAAAEAAAAEKAAADEAAAAEKAAADEAAAAAAQNETEAEAGDGETPATEAPEEKDSDSNMMLIIIIAAAAVVVVVIIVVVILAGKGKKGKDKK